MDIHLGFLPLLTIILIALSYGIYRINNDDKRGALRAAYWWGGFFFAYGVIDYFLLMAGPF